MKTISVLIVIVSSLLGGQTMALPVMQAIGELVGAICGGLDQTCKVPLIPHPPPSELLTERQLMERLDYSYMAGKSDNEVMQYIVQQLYQAINKDSYKVAADLSVSELISLSDIELNDCSTYALEGRHNIYRRAMNPMWIDRHAYGLDSYAEGLFRKAIEYCVENQQKVINRRITDKRSFDQFLTRMVFETDLFKSLDGALFIGSYLGRDFLAKNNIR